VTGRAESRDCGMSGDVSIFDLCFQWRASVSRVASTASGRIRSARFPKGPVPNRSISLQRQCPRRGRLSRVPDHVSSEAGDLQRPHATAAPSRDGSRPGFGEVSGRVRMRVAARSAIHDRRRERAAPRNPSLPRRSAPTGQASKTRRLTVSPPRGSPLRGRFSDPVPQDRQP
jgi:hypothetical protein